MIDFLIKLIVFLISIVLVLIIFNYAVRKLLGVDRRKWFSYNHINERHKRLDWSVRIVFVIYLFFVFLYTANNIEVGTPWYFQTWFIVIIFLIISELIRAFIEWKYVENKKAFIATFLELCFAISIIILTITTNFFGIF